VKTARVTFGELRALLLHLGFTESVPQHDRCQFAHPVTGTVLLFRPHRADATVGQRDMLVVRRQLVDNGLIDASAFQHFLQQATA
jgi:hypothetical protein